MPITEAITIVPVTMDRITGSDSNIKKATKSPDKFGNKAIEEIMIQIKPLFFFVVIFDGKLIILLLMIFGYKPVAFLLFALLKMLVTVFSIFLSF